MSTSKRYIAERLNGFPIGCLRGVSQERVPSVVAHIQFLKGQGIAEELYERASESMNKVLGYFGMDGRFRN